MNSIAREITARKIRHVTRENWNRIYSGHSESQISQRRRQGAEDLKDKAEAGSFDDFVLVTIQSEELNAAEIHGIVTEHLQDAVVVRFNVEGEPEEREYFWKDLNTTPDKLPVGAIVIGQTRLLSTPAPPTAEEAQAEMKRINQLTVGMIHDWGVSAKTVIGSEPTEELRQKSASAWAANQQDS